MRQTITCPVNECDGEFEVELTLESNYGANTDGLYGHAQYFLEDIQGYCDHKDNPTILRQIESAVTI